MGAVEINASGLRLTIQRWVELDHCGVGAIALVIVARVGGENATCSWLYSELTLVDDFGRERASGIYHFCDVPFADCNAEHIEFAGWLVRIGAAKNQDEAAKVMHRILFELDPQTLFSEKAAELLALRSSEEAMIVLSSDREFANVSGYVVHSDSRYVGVVENNGLVQLLTEITADAFREIEDAAAEHGDPIDRTVAIVRGVINAVGSASN